MPGFADMKDEQIIRAIRTGDADAQDYLLGKYKPFVRMKSRAYFLAGADTDDLIQEGMIGLYKAMRDYNEDKAASFRSFAELCVTRQLITAVKLASRQKHKPLNTYISLHAPAGGDADTREDILATLPAPSAENPEEALIHREELRSMENRLGASLSELECRILSQYLRGASYNQIAENVCCTKKAVDNAIQRVKRKLERARAEA